MTNEYNNMTASDYAFLEEFNKENKAEVTLYTAGRTNASIAGKEDMFSNANKISPKGYFIADRKEYNKNKTANCRQQHRASVIKTLLLQADRELDYTSEVAKLRAELLDAKLSVRQIEAHYQSMKGNGTLKKA